MREFKFRIWNAASGYGDDAVRIKQMFHVELGDTNLDQDYIIGRGYIDEEANIMQYTGLKDRKGKEIYEGDRVKFWGGCGVVVYSNGAFVISHTPEMNAIASDEFGFSKGMDIEVVGNIYENLNW